MAGNKYLQIDTNGNIAELAAVQSSAGSGDAGKIVALNASGQIDVTMLPGSGAITLTASEAIAAGALINIWSNAGVVAVRNATNTGIATKAHGFVIAAIASGASGTVYIGDGINTGVSGLTIGQNYLLGTAGAPTTTVPTAALTIIQNVGVARSATELEVIIDQNPVVRA